MNQSDLAKIRPLNNFILVKTTRENDEWEGKSGIKLKIDTSFEVEKHAVTTGEIIAVPSEIKYKDPDPCAMYPLDYNVEGDIQVGDKIFFNYLCTSNPPPNSHFKVDDDEYFFIPYSEVKCVERKGVPIPANGYVIVEPLEEASFDSEIILQPFKKGDSERRGTVRFLGELVKQYRAFKSRNIGSDVDELKVGDVVLFKDIEAIPLEYSLHAVFQGEGKTFYKMHRKDIYHRVEAV